MGFLNGDPRHSPPQGGRAMRESGKLVHWLEGARVPSSTLLLPGHEKVLDSSRPRRNGVVTGGDLGWRLQSAPGRLKTGRSAGVASAAIIAGTTIHCLLTVQLCFPWVSTRYQVGFDRCTSNDTYFDD